MTPRHGWAVCWLLCLGCHGVTPSDGETDAVRPIGFFEPSLAAQADPPRSHLSQAAAHLEKGEEIAASEHLAKYLADHPEHFEVRVHYAELLLHQAKLTVAQQQFLLAIAAAQELGDKTLRLQVRCHSLLMEIADALDDDYALHLHRGIGLYLLALERAKLPDGAGKLPVEGLLCRAAGELAQARVERPAEAQPCWYLHLVWYTLGQQGPAAKWLERARAAAPFSQLTCCEQRGLQLCVHASQFPSFRP
ncbi:MAG TPA: hypothetical protein VE988_05815 [Gemmataceae bacterium]|nr:hypothetical protein [Gemmataceae bacterium]